MNDRQQPRITGLVEDVTFHNSDNGFTVLDLNSNGEVITVVGSLPEVFCGEKLILTGEWQTHPSFGKQFRADSIEREMPAGAAAILRYLSDGAIKGIGPATAAKLVELFGDRTLEVIETDPQRLTQVKGISLDKASAIAESFKAMHGLNETITFLARYSVNAAEALQVWRRWGDDAQDMVRRDPYVLCDPNLGIGFDRIDAAAAALEKPIDAYGRIAAGLKHVLTHNLGNGHTCIPRDKLIPAARTLLGLRRDQVEDVLDSMLDQCDLIIDELNEREFIFLPEMYYSEAYSAGRVLMLMQFPPPAVENYQAQLELCERMSGIEYNPTQRAAIAAAMEKGFLVLTGGPGTGKTTTLNAIIDVLEVSGNRVAIAAPTGRAAKRINEVTGHDAKTIHRLLEVEWDVNDNAVFKRNEKNPLECDALIIDELSMTDALLFEALLRAVPVKCRLILVGDSDQLPSVGAGNVLGDLIASGKVPVVQLTEVFRQCSSSAIVTNAHSIVRGEMPNLDCRTSDFFFLDSDQPKVVACTIEDLYYRRLPKAYDLSPLTDIQVLCPGRKGMTGTRELNVRLQQRLNPPHPSRTELKLPGVIFREGDKVMQVKNNYDVEWHTDTGEEGMGIFNGDVGFIERIDHIGGKIVVRFDDRVANYAIDDALQLEHAYAVTVHKSQGSEFNAVIIPMCPGPQQLQYRSLLYTAVTRARSLLIMVGQRDIIQDMIANTKGSKRYTALARFIIEQSADYGH
ncbi:MAG: ATP-dependent RecD-like DNA helicase [Ruminococcaceae bacterium]|nr:ATP-dependent RecD-like DNA helicase [Oscillospiraceae bacterium]